jgi:biofilm PGA synthesis protein PgaA
MVDQTRGPIKRLLVFALAAAALLSVLVPSSGWARQVGHDQAIALARAGQTTKALGILSALYTNDPSDKEVFHDYLSVLSWAGQDDRVAELSTRLSPQTAPGYALEAAAHSARRRGDYIQAEYLYRAGAQRFPDDLDLPVGLILTLVDADRSQAALEQAERMEQRYSHEPTLALAKGYALEARREYFTALQNYNRILEKDPTNRTAQARRILVLDSLGASDLAVDLASQDPSLLSTTELQRILSNQSAFAVRWGELPATDETRRFEQTDRALALLENNRARLDLTSPGAADFDLRTRFDRLVALRNRYQMEAVVRDYEEMLAEGVAIPNHALLAAADAYLYLQQPEQAADIYRSILTTRPDDLTTNLALFYALIELEDFDAAYALTDRLDKAQPVQLQARRPDGSSSPRPNPDKPTTATTAAMARLYGEQYADAEARLAALHDQAPANLDITRELGNVYSARGWPRRAQQTYELGLRLDHSHRDLQIGLAQSYLDRREYRLAEQAINRLYALYPEDVHVRRLQRQWQSHNLNELRLAAGYSDNSGATQGTRDLLVEGTLFSSPLDYNYRIFASGRYAFADFPEGDETYRRYGVGIEYRRPDLEAAAELTYNVDGGDDIGGRLSLLYDLDDYWSIPLNIERFSRETPLRALKQDITADSADLGISYRFSELRNLSLRAQVMDFSDGNFRRSLAGSLEQRLVTLPKYKLSGIVDVYASANSRSNTIYFNPDRDLSAALTLDNLQRLYRRYDRSFSHRLALTAGNYWQKGYDDDYFAGFTYEHIWETAERLALVYGFSRYRRIYDGSPEYQNYYYSRINWRF